MPAITNENIETIVSQIVETKLANILTQMVELNKNVNDQKDKFTTMLKQMEQEFVQIGLEIEIIRETLTTFSASPRKIKDTVKAIEVEKTPAPTNTDEVEKVKEKKGTPQNILVWFTTNYSKSEEFRAKYDSDAIKAHLELKKGDIEKCKIDKMRKTGSFVFAFMKNTPSEKTLFNTIAPAHAAYKKEF
ncbi:MAG: hypothetical protein KAS12_01715 [Candidatus Aenigmarchaeota archaeon]|nr:hypothetical protein [Candidatus Aenigmarchaeota archaeon]